MDSKCSFAYQPCFSYVCVGFLWFGHSNLPPVEQGVNGCMNVCAWWTGILSCVYSYLMTSVPAIGSRCTMKLTRIEWLLKKNDESSVKLQAHNKKYIVLPSFMYHVCDICLLYRYGSLTVSESVPECIGLHRIWVSVKDIAPTAPHTPGA